MIIQGGCGTVTMDTLHCILYHVHVELACLVLSSIKSHSEEPY